jgi:hypothetical protein
MKTNIVIGLIAALLLGYLAYSRSLWFPELERQVAVGRDRLSKPVDIEKAGKILWRITENQWKHTGELKVALLIDNAQTLPRDALRKESMALRVVMDANAVTFEPSLSGVKEVLHANRLIRNWYYTTNEPLSPKARIWESAGGGTVEFGLCGVNRYPLEDTIIEMDILRPDTILGKANPRLVVYEDYDYAVEEHIGSLRFLRDVILCLLACCIAILSYFAMKTKSHY